MIISDNNYLVALTKILIILNCDGKTVWKFKDITYPGYAEFYQDDMLLVEGSKQWYMISLKTGEILWSIAHSKRDLSSFSYAVIDYNNKILWRMFSRDCVYYLEKLDIDYHCVELYRITNYSGAAQSIILDSSGTPLILTSIMVGEDTERQQKNTILSFDFLRKKAVAVPQTVWYDPHGITSEMFLSDCNTVLTSDLQVYHINSQKYEPWIINKGTWEAPTPWGVKTADFDRMRNLAYLRYNHADVIVDTETRTVLSQYYVKDSFGRLAFGKYWYISSDGVKSKDFPAFETVPVQKPWMITPNDVIALQLDI